MSERERGTHVGAETLDLVLEGGEVEDLGRVLLVERLPRRRESVDLAVEHVRGLQEDAE